MKTSMINILPIVLLIVTVIVAGCTAANLLENEVLIPPTPMPNDEPIKPTEQPEMEPSEPTELNLPLEDPPPAPVEEVPMTPITPFQVPQELEDLVDRAKQDLSSRLSIDPTEITVIEAREVVWSNSSLGCPQKGMVYADVLTPGYLVIFRANNFNFEYHASRGTELIYCPNPEPPAPGTSTDH